MGGLTSATGASSASASSSGGSDGNAQLSAAFDEARQKAAETMAISVKGQADLNALRARPQ